MSKGIMHTKRLQRRGISTDLWRQLQELRYKARINNWDEANYSSDEFLDVIVLLGLQSYEIEKEDNCVN